MITHVVLLSWKPEADEAAREAVLSGLRSLPEQCPEILSYTVGADAELSEGNHDLALVATFNTVDDYQTYVTNEAHVAVINEHIKPILAGRAAVQFES